MNISYNTLTPVYGADVELRYSRKQARHLVDELTASLEEAERTDRPVVVVRIGITNKELTVDTTQREWAAERAAEDES